MHALLEAVVAGDFDKVQEELNNGAWYGTVGPNGMTGLHYSALHGFPDIGQLFIDKGLFVNRTTYDGLQSMHLAAKSHQSEMVDMLMQNGAAINAVDYEGNTPLHFAVESGTNTTLVQKIIDYGAWLDTKNKAGQTAADWAANQNDLQTLQLLLQQGATSSLPDVIEAALLGDSVSVEELFDQGTWYGSTGPNGMTGLHYATVLGYPDVGQLFIDQGLFVNRTTYDGLQSMHLAAQYQQGQMVDFLMQNGAAINAVDYEGNTPLHYAVQNGASLNFVQKLLDYGAWLDTENNNGLTAADMAANSGLYSVFALLLENGASTDLSEMLQAVVLGDLATVQEQLDSGVWYGEVGANGLTGLHFAALFGAPEMGQLFLDQGLFVNRTTYDGQQPLHLAASAHQENMVNFLMQNGAAINGVDPLGNTPLHYAVQNNPDLSIVQKIIDYGAWLDTENKAGETALDWAQNEGNFEVTQLLVDNGALRLEPDLLAEPLSAESGTQTSGHSLTEPEPLVETLVDSVDENLNDLHLDFAKEDLRTSMHEILNMVDHFSSQNTKSTISMGEVLDYGQANSMTQHTAFNHVAPVSYDGDELPQEILNFEYF